VKKLYLEQQQIPVSELTFEQQTNLRNEWPMRYQVMKVIGSTTPKVRAYLIEEDVKGYCEDATWHVEIS